MGGGVISEASVLPLVRREVSELMNEYLETSAVGDATDAYITLPGLGPRAGVLGAIALAETALVETAVSV